MADLQTTYISDLAQGSIQDSTLFITDDGINTNSATAADVANFAKEKILPEANSYADTKKNEAVEESKEYTNGVISNKNLLINSNFKDPINYVGFTSIKANGSSQRIIPVWQYFSNNAGNSCQLTENGLQLIQPEAASGRIYQYFENFKELAGKTVTLSGEVEIVNSFTVYINADGSYINKGTYTNNGKFTCTFTFPDTITTSLFIMLQSNATANNNMTVKWLKLEYGNIATPFIPPNKALELLKCERYIFVLPNDSSYIASTSGAATTAYMIVPLPTEMRTIPTIIGSAMNIRGAGKPNTAVSGVAIYKKYSNAIILQLTMPTGFEANNVYFVYTREQIVFDSNIYT